ncbi:hypothetical protein BDV98DRAFT_497744 [Pterulicium gracile]|uniref:Uncharacterized protein n=1 Tax=Pterulicium gracile TaxID=1884261 RepID=A0A5C3R009_9AGAR|nr:hypothetical protein BDV98DRAFT_497744 [Pterula gracilis]
MLDSGILPFRTSSIPDFQVERSMKSLSSRKQAARTQRLSEVDRDDAVLRDHVARLFEAKHRPFTTGGCIPMDPSQLVLFFRSKSGITHSLDFPIDVQHETPPALDVLIGACRPHPSALDDYSDRESLFYPPNLPLTTSLELANHPILEAVRNALFPLLPTGHYLVAARDKLEVLVSGGRMDQQRSIDGRAATVIITLPVRFRGGAMVVHDPDGRQEKFYGRGGKQGDIEWTAFLADCNYEVQTVDKGCRVSISYGVYIKSFGSSGAQPEPLITPNDVFLDVLSPILNICRGRKIAFYLANEYAIVDPAETLAESLVPELKGGDSLLYHALKLFKLMPELHWSAGGYMWPVDRPAAISTGAPAPLSTPVMRGMFAAGEEDQHEDLRMRVRDSGAVPLGEADVMLLSDWNTGLPVGKQRVNFVLNGEIEKLVVYTLMVVYVA